MNGPKISTGNLGTLFLYLSIVQHIPNLGTERSAYSFIFFKVKTIFLGPLSYSLLKVQIPSIYFQKFPSRMLPHLGQLVAFTSDASYSVG